MTGLDRDKLEFPQTFIVKIIFTSALGDQVNRSGISGVLDRLRIPHGEITSLQSSKGSYTSYHVSITIGTYALFQQVYTDLQRLDGVKLVI